MMDNFWARLATDPLQERHLLLALINSVPDMIYVKDLQNRFVLVNKATLERHGLTGSEQMIGKTDVDLFGEAGHEWIEREQHLLQSGEPALNYEFATQDKHGKPMWVLISKVPLRDSKGNIVGLIGINRNITERKLAEKVIDEHQDRFLATAEGSLSAFFILESVRDSQGQITDFRFTYINSRGEEMIDMKRDQILGAKLCELLPVNRTEGFFEKYVTVVETRAYIDEEFCLPQPEGRVVWRHHQVVPLGDGIAIMSQDITERKRDEEQLQYQANLIQNITDAVISTQLDYTIVSWNTGAEIMYGWKAEEVLGKHLRELTIPDQWPEGELAEREKDFVVTGQWKGELIHRRRDGTTFPVHSAVSLVRDSTGMPVGAVAVNRDITERKQAEQQQLDLALERERVETMQQFISEISHDLKNPLTSIKVNLYMIEKAIADPNRRRHHMENLAAQVEHMENMLDDLLTLSRLNQAAEEFNFARLDINELVQQIVFAQEAGAARRNQTLTFIPSDSLPPVMADNGKLYRAITNIVVNALKYTPEGGEIRVSTHMDVEHVIIVVQDTGIGIDERNLPHIFDRFYQVNRKRASGSGLGLAIAQRVILAHRGNITVESKMGEGSTFRIWLPLPER
jgi:PAS domain S-box-containing protein